MEGHGCHPIGARNARPSRPFCSDFREGRCHPVGRDDSARHSCVFTPSGECASARFFAPRCFAQNDKVMVILRRILSSVILRSAATKDPARARNHKCRLHPPSCLPFEGRWIAASAARRRGPYKGCSNPLGCTRRGAQYAPVPWDDPLGQLPASRNDPLTMAFGRDCSPQRGAEWGGCPSLPLARCYARPDSCGAGCTAYAVHKIKTGCARFPRLHAVAD